MKRKETGRQPLDISGSNSSWKPRWDNNHGDGAISKGRVEVSKGKDEGASRTTPKAESQSLRTIKCFKCLGTGHTASQFPNKMAMILQDNGELVSESGDDYEGMPTLEEVSDGDKVEFAVGELMVTRQALNTQIKADDSEQQRENILHT